MSALSFALAFTVTLNLSGVVMLDGVEECAQHLDELRVRGIGDPRQEKRDDDGNALHVSSSMAVAMCSALMWREWFDAAAERA